MTFYWNTITDGLISQMNYESNFMMMILSGTITTIWRHQWQPPPPMSTKWSRPAAAQPRAIATSGRPPYRDSPTRCGPWRGGGTWRRGCRLIFKYFWYFRNISFSCRPRPLCHWTDRQYTPGREQAVPVLPTVVNMNIFGILEIFLF